MSLSKVNTKFHVHLHNDYRGNLIMLSWKIAFALQFFATSFALDLSLSPARPLVYGKYLERTSSGSLSSAPNTIWFFQSPKATSAAPAPVVFQVHGGGYVSGSATKSATEEILGYLSAGVSFASLEYRLVGQVES